MCRKTKKILLIFIFVFSVFVLTSCSLEDLSSNLNQLFESVTSSLSNFWNSIVESYNNFPSVFERILSGLSGIGDMIQHMFERFGIF